MTKQLTSSQLHIARKLAYAIEHVREGGDAEEAHLYIDDASRVARKMTKRNRGLAQEAIGCLRAAVLMLEGRCFQVSIMTGWRMP